MLSLIPTEEVAFERPRVTYGDDGVPSRAWRRIAVAQCAVEPVEAGPVDAGEHPEGARGAVRIHVPKALSGPLRGCRAVVRGVAYEIEGDPIPLTSSPLPFDRVLKAVRADG